MNKRKICVVTGSRAEYGLLYWLMKEIQVDADLELQIIATGSHLSPEFGLTYKLIEEDGFQIHEKIEMLLSSDTAVGITKSLGLAIIGFADAFERLKPDLVVLLGDRYEIFAVAQAAMLASIPIAHIAGGEVTEGAVDEAIRHSVTKMSQLHFVAAEVYRRRVLQLGETPEKVYNFGHTAMDNIAKMELLSRQALEETLKIKFRESVFLVTYHPVTLGTKDVNYLMHNLFMALDSFPDATVIITKPNADKGGREIIKLLDIYAGERSERIHVFTSLGQLRYLSLVKVSDIVIGNSSSGIVEAPFLKVPTINIGERQRGRIMASSIISCDDTSESILSSIKYGLSPGFRENIQSTQSLYGQAGASRKIKNIIKEADLKNITYKKFCDW